MRRVFAVSRKVEYRFDSAKVPAHTGRNRDRPGVFPAAVDPRAESSDDLPPTARTMIAHPGLITGGPGKMRGR